MGCSIRLVVEVGMNAPLKGDSWGGLGFRCITIYHKEEKQCLKYVRVYFKCVRVCFNIYGCISSVGAIEGPFRFPAV